MISLTEMDADVNAILSDLGTTCTVARLASMATMLNSYGEASMSWQKVTTTLVRLRAAGMFTRTSPQVMAAIGDGGIASEVRRIGIAKRLTDVRSNDRIYVGANVTTTATKWHVGMVIDETAHRLAVLVDKGPRQP